MSTAVQADEPQPDTHEAETEKAMVVGVFPMMTSEGYFATYLWGGPMWAKETSKGAWLMINPYGKFSPDSGYWGLGVTFTFEWMLGGHIGFDLMFDVAHDQHLNDFEEVTFGLGAGPGITIYPSEHFFLGLYGTANWDLRYMTPSVNPGIVMGFL